MVAQKPGAVSGMFWMLSRRTTSTSSTTSTNRNVDANCENVVYRCVSCDIYVCMCYVANVRVMLECRMHREFDGVDNVDKCWQDLTS